MKFIVLLLSLLCYTTALAQTGKATVYGTVTDGQSAMPLAFVTVVAQGAEQNAAAASLPALGALSNASGYFEIAGLATGNYTLTISIAGYAPTTTNVLVFAGNDNYNLGTVPLTASTAPEEIVIVGQQLNSTPTLDSRVYDLDDNIAQATGSVVDVLRTLPGITVAQEGRVQLRGSERVVILIDGKQSSLTGFGNQAGLDSIPAAGIASIEIINNPSRSTMPLAWRALSTSSTSRRDLPLGCRQHLLPQQQCLRLFQGLP
jgi:hypothetical protein